MRISHVLSRLAHLVMPACAAAVVPALLAAQSPDAATGKITGRIVDAATGQGIAAAGVQVVGTTNGTQSGVDGRYTILRVPAGTVTLQVRRIGYGPKTVTGIVIAAGATIEQDITLKTADVQLAAVAVTATKEKGTVSEALNNQRTAVGVVNAITAEQIAKSPDANAAQAVQRVSGVTVQDNKYVFVRGLGERYTTSSLNGARVPSPEPEKRVVPLDMFPSGLLQSVTTIKTFTPDQQGDFSGALVDIKTREFPARRTATLSFGSGYEAGATGTTLLQPLGTGGERFALVNNQRDLPGLVRYAGNFVNLNLTQGDKNLLISQFRNAWTPSTGTGSPALNGSVSVGGSSPLLGGHRVGYLLSGTMSTGTDVKIGQVRAQADRGPERGTTIEQDRFEGTTSQQSVLWGGLANFSTQVGAASRLSVNALYNRTADNSARVETGTFSSDQTQARITRMQYVERSVHSLQLAGDHLFGERSHFEWFGTVSGVSRNEPDKSEFVQILEQDSPTATPVYRWFGSGNGGAVRTFSLLNENSRELNAKYSYAFGQPGRQTIVKVGGLLRSTDRAADNRAFNISGRGLTNAMRELPAEALFDGRFTTSTSAVFDIGPLAQGGAYSAADQLSASFVMAEIPVGERFRIITGGRYELDHLRVSALSTLGRAVETSKVWGDFLPSFAVNMQLTPNQQLRFSASRTLARPEYRELSPVISRDVVGGDDVAGNENLQRTNVTNGDLRWEFYPNPGELISVALFAKQFNNPIERVYRASSSARQVYFANADKADNYGVELELRKDLGFIATPLRAVSAFSNVTVMRSQIHLSSVAASSLTNDNRAMVGQAPYVFNAGLTYSTLSGGSSATVQFNRVGERIDVAGESPLPDVVLTPRNMLDVSLRMRVSGAVTFRADARNLLDAPYQTMQGSVMREFYRPGRTFQAGIQVRP
jgi:hypothetical protein